MTPQTRKGSIVENYPAKEWLSFNEEKKKQKVQLGFLYSLHWVENIHQPRAELQQLVRAKILQHMQILYLIPKDVHV